MADYRKILSKFFRLNQYSDYSQRALIRALKAAGSAGITLTGTIKKAVSGTAGNSGNLAEWDANGNLVDSGHDTNQDLKTSDDVEFNQVYGNNDVRVGSNLSFTQGSALSSDDGNGNTILDNMYNALLEVEDPRNNVVERIDSSNFKNGSIIFLKFDTENNNTFTVKNKIGKNDDIHLNFEQDQTFNKDDLLVLQYHDLGNNRKEWREMGRAAQKPVSGDFVGTTDTQTLTNKTVEDNNFSIVDESDNSKEAKIEVSNISSSTTKSYSLPNSSTTLTDPIITEFASQTIRDKIAYNLTLNDTTFSDGGSPAKVDLGTSNGTKLGSSASQLLAFYNQTPTSQPSSTGETTGLTQNTGTTVNNSSTFTGNVGSTAYTINDIVKHLKNLGLIAE